MCLYDFGSKFRGDQENNVSFCINFFFCTMTLLNRGAISELARQCINENIIRVTKFLNYIIPKKIDIRIQK